MTYKEKLEVYHYILVRLYHFFFNLSSRPPKELFEYLDEEMFATSFNLFQLEGPEKKYGAKPNKYDDKEEGIYKYPHQCHVNLLAFSSRETPSEKEALRCIHSIPSVKTSKLFGIRLKTKG